MSNSSTLRLEYNAFSARKAALYQIPTPEPTDTWNPVSHGSILNAVFNAAEENGLAIRSEAYGLTGKPGQDRYGDRMFGVIDFENGTNDYGFSLGIRNSHDKSIAAGICAGAKVFVCSNLIMSGDFSEKRKHTPGNNFLRLIREAFTLLPGQLENLAKNLDRLKLEGIEDQEAEHIIFNAARAGAINSSMILPIWEEYKAPTFEEFADPTQFNLLMAFTEKLKGENRVSRVDQAYRKLADIFTI